MKGADMKGWFERIRAWSRLVACCGALTVLAGAAPCVAQPAWKPERPVVLVVPYSPGGGVDTMARHLAKELQRKWGQSVVVENMPGADGLIGTRRVTGAAPDGHTLLVQIPSLTIIKHLPGFKGPDPVTQLAPVSTHAVQSGVIVVHPSVPATNMAELVRYCKSGKVACSFGTTENSAKLQAHQKELGLADSALLPVIQIGNASFGAAPGAPAVASVGNADAMVDLFNSAASKALLVKPEDASLHEAYYKAFLGLNAAAGRSTNIKQLGISKVAVNLLGKNLSDQLRPSAADLTDFGVTGATPTNVQGIAKAVIIGLNAFKLGLTNMVIVPFMLDDPHGAFAGGDAAVATRAQQLGTIFDAMMKKAATIQDPAGGSKALSESLGWSLAGDTPKQAYNRNGWPDGSPGNSNHIYCFGNGFLKTGWFGDVQTGTANGWSAETGAVVPGKTSAQTENEAVAAVLYAVAKGDAREVNNFARVPSLAGVTNVVLL